MRNVFSILALALLFLPAARAQSPARKALFLLNSDYKNIPALTAPGAAVDELQAALTAAKFDVHIERNLTQAQLAGDLDKQYLATLKPGDTLLFYYQGYALQANGDNFLVPTDFDPQSANPIHFLARSLTGFMQALDEKKIGLKIILIDASVQSTQLLPKATGPGLGEPDFTDLRDIAYLSSAAKNAPPVPLNEAERILFARQLAALIRKPGTSLVELMAGTQSGVASKTQNLNPYFSSQTSRQFRFTDPPPPPPEKEPTDEFITKPRVSSRDRQAYVYVPAGTFKMGCVPNDAKCEDTEKPQHEVTITKAFWMGETEVQVEAYMKFADTATPRRKMPSAPMDRKKWDQTNLPMANMSYEDADAFCKWTGGRLPTEAEWEYAARGGKENEIVPLNAENAREKANFTGKKGNDRFEFTAPVRQFDPNGYGLFDMFGNVWEFTADYFADKYYAESPKQDPPGPASGKERVLRGGSWDSDPAKHLRISFRKKGLGGNIVGFRCVIPDSEEARKTLR